MVITAIIKRLKIILSNHFSPIFYSNFLCHFGCGGGAPFEPGNKQTKKERRRQMYWSDFLILEHRKWNLMSGSIGLENLENPAWWPGKPEKYFPELLGIELWGINRMFGRMFG